MSVNNWYKIDNVAKVFLATIGKRDTKALRVSVTLKEDIDPALLQEALDETIQIRPQFQIRIRRGLFWHYLEETDIRPIVEEEDDRPCPLLYARGKAMLHYKVTYFHNRINLELFHAISDGTGALEFLNVLILEYLRLKYNGQFDEIKVHSGASADELTEDSFRQFFETPGLKGSKLKRAYTPGGMRLPYDQLHFFELQMPSKKVLLMAKEMGVSLTSLIGALLMLSIRDEMPTRKNKLPVTISLPVNLRNYYPSNTSRNFFNNVNISHVFTENISLEELAKEFDTKLKSNLSPDKIKSQMDSFETMEFAMIVRPVPLFIKQWVVSAVAKAKDKKVSAVLSNLGVRSVDEKLIPYIENYSAFCSSSNAFVVMSSFKDILTLGITSPFVNTAFLKDFVREFTARDIEVTAYATEVVT